jgi:hypothetical protein
MLFLLVAAPAAAAAEPEPLPPALDATLTDGNEYAVTEREGAVWILSETTGREVRLEKPTGCGVSALGAATLAFLCREDRSLRLYDIRSGSWSRLPDPEQFVHGLFSPDYGLPVVSVGRRWIQLYGGPDCYHCDDWVVRLSREFGEPGPEEPSSRRIYEDLDDPRLWVPLCPPLRRMPNPHYDPSEFSAFRYFDPTVFGRRALTFDSHLRPSLRRCGQRRGKRLTRSRNAQAVQVGGGFVTWLDKDPASETARGVAVAYELATRRRRRWRIPGPANQQVSVSHTRRRLFIDKVGEENFRASRRYSVRLRP